ncbi:MAG TPA: DinB family protein [Acidimicrobiales bacterium]|nr:DinB family protein [Acidimicrobiales bacterium]
MPGDVPPVADERQGLTRYLAQMRYVVRLAAYGLDDDQARATPTRSPLSVGGIIKHLASVEGYWTGLVEGRPPTGGAGAYEDGFRPGPDQTLQDLLERYAEAAARTDAVVGALDLGHPVPVPEGVPWFPKDVEAWSVRWVLLHLIEETARHAGHADMVREALDGATAFPLMAAAEGWEPTPWLQPWEPGAGGGA